ncbi:MAG: hypothetical protein JWQ05_3155, partial [Methylobacterium sp.]|nr:hypothetical protein [Methylobacterium sp.]
MSRRLAVLAAPLAALLLNGSALAQAPA